MVRTIRIGRMAVVVGRRFVLSEREHICCGGVNIDVKIAIVWNMPPCSVVEIYRCFRKICCPVWGWVVRTKLLLMEYAGSIIPDTTASRIQHSLHHRPYLQSWKHKLVALDIFCRWLVLLVTVFRRTVVYNLWRVYAVFSLVCTESCAVWSVVVTLLFAVGSAFSSVTT